MKNNAQYTALEVLEAVAEKFVLNEKEYSAEEVFGKFAVIIGGISGIVKPDHLLSIPSEAKTLQVVVGVESFELPLEENEGERERSESFQSVKEEMGKSLPTKEEVRARAAELAVPEHKEDEVK